MVDPAPVDDLRIVQMCHLPRSEEARADVSYETSDAVHGENVQGIVDSKDELEFRGVVGEPGSQDTVGDGGPGGHVAFSFQNQL